MTNPYRSYPAFTDWRRAVAAVDPAEMDPVTEVPFRIGANDAVATAGSCFAQHIARRLVSEGFRYLVTETAPGSEGAIDEGYGVFPARFANIYTVRQLLQLFERAYGLFEPRAVAWRRADGAFVDPFRPRIQAAGFGSVAALLADREHHLASVRTMFETCDVFVFTLGLTEAWVSVADGAVVPLAPGVVKADDAAPEFVPENFEVAAMSADLAIFIDRLRVVNPSARVLLTVSPVPLVATFEPRHVLVSTTVSKSALRVVADAATRARPGVAYFPSYEIITGAYAGARYFAPDLREVTPEGVDHVMRVFSRHFLTTNAEAPATQTMLAERDAGTRDDDWQRMSEMNALMCDEEEIGRA